MTDTVMVTLSRAELGDLMTEAVRKGLSQAKQERRPLTSADVAKLLGLTSDTVNRLVREEGLPARRVGRFYRFFHTEVMTWVDSRAA